MLDRIDTLRTQIIARPPTANARVQNPGQSSTQVNEEARYHLVEAVTAGTRFRDGTVNIRNLIDQLIDTPSPVVRWEVIRLGQLPMKSVTALRHLLWDSLLVIIVAVQHTLMT